MMMMMMMEPKALDLYEFLVESELQQYYNSIKNELKITMVSHLKYASDEDLKQVGLSKPEIRRLRKFYEKFYPHGYLSKIKRLLQTPVVKKEDGTICNPTTSLETVKVSSTTKIPSNKHIIPADSICVNKQLGTGEFGIVQQGVWTNGTERIQVAIKCLCRERMQSNPMEFLKEAAIMHSIEHENIVRLYGVVLDTDSLMLVTELAHLRSLLECLKDSGLRVSFLTVPTLCEFAQQICNGMMYLENKRLIHRDLAARNILVFSKNKVKISDFGLSRALGVGKDYYQTNFNVNLKLPIAWCAPECINFLRFTNASDVWAYGVCLWEMFSYGFQPWAALTGHQILEAIDEPNYQRLEAPECCPKEYYSLMLKCWQHDPGKRPKFNEIFEMLPEMKPEQLKTILGCNESKKDYLLYRQNEIISVLDKSTNSPYWKGVLNSGKTGIFNPANTVTYLGSLPSSRNYDSFSRTTDRASKRKLRTEMISMPQNDLKHTGHVGLDGAYFGDVAFLSNAQNYNHVPRQIVTPYKPSEDIEQTPLLLPPTPTSPDSLQTASGYFSDLSTTNHTFINQKDTVLNVANSSGIDVPLVGTTFNFNNQQTSLSVGLSSSNPFAFNNDNNMHSLSRQNVKSQSGSFTNTNLDDNMFQKNQQQRHKNIKWPDIPQSESPHEYHEISDDEITSDKVFDLGPSLLDEMDFMFRSMSTTTSDHEPKSPEMIDTANKKNEITELASKLQRKNSGNRGVSSSLSSMTSKSKKKAGTVKPISIKDEKILNQAIDFANEITARSMTDLVCETTNIQSPKRKFSFRFPNLSHHNSMEKENHNLTNTGNTTMAGTVTNSSPSTGKNRNFSEELKNTTDLQNSITEECREAYNNLVEKPSQSHVMDYDKTKLEHSDNLLTTHILSATLPRKSIHQLQQHQQTNENFSKTLSMKKPKDVSLSLPINNQQRPASLSYRNSLTMATSSMTISDDSCNVVYPAKSPEVDANPLRILRDKNYPIVRSRIKVCTTPAVLNDETDRSIIIQDEADSTCESPSYLTNTEYTFSERDVNIHRGIQKQIATKDIENLNPIPLPPRDRSKVMQTNVKRHIRKHPLIIPASGLQRTLNKVTSSTETKNTTFINQSVTNDLIKNINHQSTSSIVNSDKHSTITKLKNFDHAYINQEAITILPQIKTNLFNNNSDIKENRNDKDDSISDCTYENLEILRYQMQDCTDSASLHFESIMEDDRNKNNEMSSPDVVNGFMFEIIHKDHYEKPNVNQLDGESDEIRNLDIEKRKLEFSQKHPKYIQPKNELSNNILFNKVKESVESVILNRCSNDLSTKQIPHSTLVADIDITDGESSFNQSNLNKSTNSNSTEMLKEKFKNSNSVSCEDLLEFSDKKPKGRERGVESDEVRIMTKVLGTVATPEHCIEALNFIDWDVHKAIKLIMLRKTLKSCKLSLEECVEALQKYEWDLQTTTIKLRTL